MSSSRTHSLALTPHPAAGRLDAVREIEVRVSRDPNGGLALKYTLRGDPGRLAIPPARAPQRADELWRHTCFEAFIAPGTGPAYLELNFSPSGEWASYEFAKYREQRRLEEPPTGPVAPLPAPSSRTLRTGEDLTLEADVALECMRGATPVRIALASVVEDASGQLWYWALRHPPGRPDFHHPDGFALQI